MSEINIPTFYPEPEFNESLGYSVYLCPVSQANTYEWDGPYCDYPKELVYYEVNLVGEMSYIRPEFENLHLEYWESEDLRVEFECFDDYLISKLPNNNYYRLIVVDPDGVEGDFATFIYEGVYPD